MPRIRYHPVLIFSCIGHSLDHIFMLIYPVAVIPMAVEFGWSYGEMVALLTPSVVLFGAGAIPAGWLADRWSARGMLAIMFFGMGAASVLTGLARNPIEIAVGLAAIGVFASIYHPVATAIVVRYAVQRGRDLGINGVFGGLGIGSGPLIAGILTDSFGWREAFIIPGIVCLAVGIAFVLMVGEIEPAESAQKHSGGASANGGAVLPVFAAIVAVGVCVGFLFQTGTVAMPKVFEQRLTFLGGALAWVGGLTALVYYCGAAAQFFGGLLADRFPMKWLVVGALTLQVPVTLIMAVAWDWSLFAVAICLAVFTLGLQPVVDSLVAHYVPPAWHARAFGTRFLAAIVASSISVPAVGWVFDATGSFFWLFAGLSIFAAIGALTALFLLPGEKRLVAAE
jgi:MFS transporter, FSR family, fosmidomycin resistance protein